MVDLDCTFKSRAQAKRRIGGRREEKRGDRGRKRDKGMGSEREGKGGWLKLGC